MTTDQENQDDVGAMRAELASMRRAIDDLRADNAELRAQIEGTRRPWGADPAAAPTAADGTGVTPPLAGHSGPTPADRRAFLRGGALAAGVLAAGAASVATAAPAAAANDDALILGNGNTATRGTGLSVDLSGAPEGETVFGLGVADGTTAVEHYLPAALLGLATGAPLQFGVQGLATQDNEGLTDSAGVLGFALGTKGIGLYATAFGDASVGVLSDVPNAGGVGVDSSALGSEGVGIRASGTAYGLDVTGDRSTMLLRGPDHFPPVEPGVHQAGELHASVAEDGTTATLWFCVESGDPGTWRRLAGAGSSGALTLLGQTVRIYDSRPGNPPLGGNKTPLTGATSPRLILTEGIDALPPAGVAGLLVNLTVVNTSAGGFVALHKGGVPWPGNSTINWTATGSVIANSAVVAVDAGGVFAATCAAGASTDLIVDLVGYYL